MKTYHEMDAVQLQELLQKDAGHVSLIDVRTSAEVAQEGTIPGARHIPLHLLPLQAEELCDGRPLVFYCRSGNRSAQACSYLAARGCDHVINLRGGYKAWLHVDWVN
jgi:rhodanese-related sulfurtransferase